MWLVKIRLVNFIFLKFLASIQVKLGTIDDTQFWISSTQGTYYNPPVGKPNRNLEQHVMGLRVETKQG